MARFEKGNRERAHPATWESCPPLEACRLGSVPVPGTGTHKHTHKCFFFCLSRTLTSCHTQTCPLHKPCLHWKLALQERWFATYLDAVVQNTIPKPMLKQGAVGGPMLLLCPLFTFCLSSSPLLKGNFVNWVTERESARGSKAC
eukprot:1143660-Pelagomonas_calceolata.AAC.2